MCLPITKIAVNPAMYTPAQIQILHKAQPITPHSHWLSRHNHNENIGKEIAGMNLNINAIKIYIDIQECMIVDEIMQIPQTDDQLNALTMCDKQMVINQNRSESRNPVILAFLN